MEELFNISKKEESISNVSSFYEVRSVLGLMDCKRLRVAKLSSSPFDESATDTSYGGDTSNKTITN